MWRTHNYVISSPEVIARAQMQRGEFPRLLLCNYFHRVAMPKAAAMPPMPIRMFQFPRALMKGM